MSLYQFAGILAGVISGLVWEKLGTTAYKNLPTITPSLVVNVWGKSLHFHHWVVYLALLLCILIIAIKMDRTFHPSILMILSFFTSAMFYDFFKFSDWYIFINK